MRHCSLLTSLALCAALSACHPTVPIQSDGDAGPRADAGGDAGPAADAGGPACSATQVHCGPTPSSECETNLDDDAQNCGACGHVCPGGELCRGLCIPVALASGHKDAEGLAVAGGRVVWTDDDSLGGAVYSLPLDGGYVSTLSSGFIFSTSISPQRVRSDGSHAYYAYEGSPATLRKVRIDGLLREVTLVDGEERIGDLALGDGAVFYTNPIAGTVRSVSVDGGAPPLVAANQATPSSIAVGADAVYWTNLGRDGGMGSVMKAPLDGGAPGPVAEGVDEPQGLQLAADGLYWGTGAGEIVRSPLDGGPPAQLSAGRGVAVRDLAIDASGLYWVDQAGEVFRAPRAGGAATLIGTSARQLALDDQAVYWTFQTGDWLSGPPRNGGVARLVKEP
jgi:hypothetical protein